MSVDHAQLAHALGILILAYHQCLQSLMPETDNKIKEFTELSDQQINQYMHRLYETTKAAAHQSVTAFITPPEKLSPKNCEKLKQYYLSMIANSSELTELEIGNAYQLNSQIQRKLALKQIQASNKDLSNKEIILFTQLYTPKWVVDELLEHTIGKKTDLPAAQMTMIDPACGAGHFLLPAFDLLLAKMITEGSSESEAVNLLASKNIAAVDIDPNAIWMSSLALTVRCLRLKTPLTPRFQNIQLLESENLSDAELLGTLDRNYDKIEGHPLSKRYTVVLTNPPYIGRKLLSRRQKQLLKTHYPDENHDIAVAFTRRCLELLAEDGALGVITQSSIFYLPSSEQFRRTIIDNYGLNIAIEAGIGVFSMQSGEKIDSLLLVLKKQNSSSMHVDVDTLFIDLRSDIDKETALAELHRSSSPNTNNNQKIFRRNIKNFTQFPHLQFNYACPASAVKLFQHLPHLENITEVRQGLATTDNERFLRYAWDVLPTEINKTWFPYVKGAGSQRWFSPILNVVDWKNSGENIKSAVVAAYPYLKGKYHWVVKNEQYYFKEGLSFSFINNANFAVRTLPDGCIFDVAASALFPHKVSRYALLAYLNSSFAGKMAHLANPTINFQVGDVKRLPWPAFNEEKQQELDSLARRCIEITAELFQHENPALNSLLQNQGIKAAHDGSLALLHGPEAAQLDTLFEFQDQTIKRLRAEIVHLENEINQQVLDHINALAILNSDEFVELKTWIENSTPPAKEFNYSVAEFAEEWLVTRAIQKIVKEDQIASITENSATSITQFFDISAIQNKWLSNALAMSVNEWFLTRFKDCLKMRFFAHPPILTATTARAKELVLISSKLLREQSNHKTQNPNNGKEQALANMLALCNSQTDWTSKDLQEKINEFRVNTKLRTSSVL